MGGAVRGSERLSCCLGLDLMLMAVDEVCFLVGQKGVAGDWHPKPFSALRTGKLYPITEVASLTWTLIFFLL